MTDTALMGSEHAEQTSTPVTHTPARYRALCSVRDDLVRYDRAQAQWRLRAGRDWVTVQGAQRRTLHDLLDLQLIEHHGEDSSSRRVALTRRGEAALLLWEPVPGRS